MKRILMIAPNCYPVTGAEEIVNMKMLQAFSKNSDFVVDLISKRKRKFNYPSGDIESYNVPVDELKIVEVDNKVNIKTIFQNFLCLCKFGVAYFGCHWAIEALVEAEKLIKEHNYSYILTKSHPSFLVGRYLQKKYNVKWVATWNDPFPFAMSPKPYGKGLDSGFSISERRIISIMSKADVHVFPSKRICNYMLKYLKIVKEQTRIIPHAVIDSNITRNIANDGSLKLIHSGNLKSPRDPRTFLEGLRLFIEKQPDAAIEFTILGRANLELNNEIQSNNLSKYVKYHEPVEYKKSLEILAHYDVAVIIEADCKEGIYLPTKVSDFMQNKIPIFTVSPAIGELNDLYKEKAIPYFADVKNPYSVCSELEKIWEDFTSGKLGKNSLIKKEFLPNYIIEQYISM